MTNDTQTILEQIFARLCFHAGTTPELKGLQGERFVQCLKDYPQDLICAAYHHLSRHHPKLPTEDDFIRFMAPEYTRRQCEMMEAV